MDGIYVGIDFGTCNIKVSRYDDKNNEGKPMKIDDYDKNPEYMVPNIIAYESRDNYNIGNRARKKLVDKPDFVVDTIKRKLEIKDWVKDFEELGFSLSAAEVTEDIFSWIHKNTERIVGRKLEGAVITVPVCFTEVQKKSIVQAARKAGIPVQAVVYEPVASVFSIQEIQDQEFDEDQVFMVFDWGGATLDICLFTVRKNNEDEMNIDIISSVGMDFGGIDITQLLWEECIYPKYRENIDRDMEADKNKTVRSNLIKIVNELKEELFMDEEEEVSDQYFSTVNPDNIFEIVLTMDEVRECFEKNRIGEKIGSLLDEIFEGDLEKEDVTLVKFFGGTSRISLVREILEEYFENPDICDTEDYDVEEAYYAVSDGAAFYAGMLANPDTKIHIDNSVPFYLGVDRAGSFCCLVRKNQKYGFFSPLKSLSTLLSDYDDLSVPVYQSFTETTELNTDNSEVGAVYVGTVNLKKELYEGYEDILFKFGVNHQGIIVGRFYGYTQNNEPELVEETGLEMEV